MTDDLDGQSTPRWVQRFDSFRRAMVLLKETGVADASRELSRLELEGFIQRFEYCWELGWRTIADLLQHEGVEVFPMAPRTVIREAFAAGIIGDGDGWIDALRARNKMAHVYTEEGFLEVLAALRTRYLPLMIEFEERLIPLAGRSNG